MHHQHNLEIGEMVINLKTAKALEPTRELIGTAIEPYPPVHLAGYDAEAVVLDLMQPGAAGRQLVGFGWEARRDEPTRRVRCNMRKRIELGRGDENCRVGEQNLLLVDIGRLKTERPVSFHGLLMCMREFAARRAKMDAILRKNHMADAAARAAPKSSNR